VAGLTGAILYLVHHIVVQATLFLVSGLVHEHAGTDSLARLGGVAHSAPLIAALFALPALSVSGVPPLSGFVAKLALLQAGIAAGRLPAYVLAAGAVLTSLLTLMAMARVWVRAFWGTGTTGPGGSTGSRGTALTRSTTAVMVGIGIGLAALAGPLSAVSHQAATDLIQRTPYQQAVLGEAAG